MTVSREAVEVHESAPVVDLHCDMVLRWRYLRADLARSGRPTAVPARMGLGHSDLPRLRRGGVALVVLGIPAPVTDAVTGPGVAEQLMLAAHAAMARDGRTRVWAGDDLHPVKRRGELRAVFAIEGAHLVGFDLGALPAWKGLGLRMVGPAHLVPNIACQPSSRPSKADVPLSGYGRSLVEAIDEQGLVLDLAHMNARGFTESLRIHRGPVLVSHAGIARAHQMWRNVSDEQAKAVADRDGVIGIILYPLFLRGGLTGSVADVVRHIEAVVDLVGADHVGLGSDFDGGITLPRQMRDASDLVVLTDSLLRRGHTAERCHAILGGNALRVLGRAG